MKNERELLHMLDSIDKVATQPPASSDISQKEHRLILESYAVAIRWVLGIEETPHDTDIFQGIKGLEDEKRESNDTN